MCSRTLLGCSDPHQCPLGKLAILPSLYTDVRSILMVFYWHLKVGCKILIFANKQDATGALPAAEISKRLGLDVLKGKSYHIQDCCALTGEGLYDGMEWISNQIRTR